MPKKILLFGGSGGIGSAIGEMLSTAGYEVVLGGRINKEGPAGDFFAVINAAGVILPRTISDGRVPVDALWEFTVNTLGALKIMNQYGKDPLYVHIGSTAAKTCRAGWSGYNMSKAALVALVKTAANEGYNVYCISPGRTKTKMREKLFGAEPPGTLLEPTEVAALVLYHVNAFAANQVVSPGYGHNLEVTRT